MKGFKITLLVAISFILFGYFIQFISIIGDSFFRLQDFFFVIGYLIFLVSITALGFMSKQVGKIIIVSFNIIPMLIMSITQGRYITYMVLIIHFIFFFISNALLLTYYFIEYIKEKQRNIIFAIIGFSVLLVIGFIDIFINRSVFYEQFGFLTFISAFFQLFFIAGYSLYLVYIVQSLSPKFNDRPVQEVKVNPIRQEFKYCRRCGALLEDDKSVCLQCGFSPLNGHNYCQVCGTSTEEEQLVCTACGSKLLNKKQPQIVTHSANDTGNIGYFLLGFFIPLVGLIMYLVLQDTQPKNALASGKGALFGFITGVALALLIFLMISLLAFTLY